MQIEVEKENRLPLVAVVVPVYNATELIKETIASVLTQSFQNFVLILVNDGSTKEGTINLLEELKELDSRITVVHKKNGGVSSARNFGISLAEQLKVDYVAMLDSDDLWGCDTLTKQVNILENNPNAVLAYAGICFINEDNTVKYGCSQPNYRGDVSADLIEQGNFIANGSNSLIKVEGLKKLRKEYLVTCKSNTVKYFDESLCYAEEWDFFLKLSLIGDFEYVDEVQCFYRVYSSSSSSRFDKLVSESGIVVSNALLRYNQRREYNNSREVNKPLTLANIYLSLAGIVLSRCTSRVQCLSVPGFLLKVLRYRADYIFNEVIWEYSFKWICFSIASPASVKKLYNLLRYRKLTRSY